MRYMGAAFDFNPRSPHRERLRRTQRSLWQGGFQSTLPSQGATDLRVGIYTGGSHFNPRSPHRERRGRVGVLLRLLPISIHAPLTGSDFKCFRIWIFASLFQSTLPSQGATLNQCIPSLQKQISIHAPLTGSDEILYIHPALTSDFNPRSPHRERHNSSNQADTRKRFQSTLPSQGATANIHIKFLCDLLFSTLSSKISLLFRVFHR